MASTTKHPATGRPLNFAEVCGTCDAAVPIAGLDTCRCIARDVAVGARQTACDLHRRKEPSA